MTDYHLALGLQFLSSICIYLCPLALDKILQAFRDQDIEQGGEMKKERQSSIFVESWRIIDICVMVDNPFTIESKTS